MNKIIIKFFLFAFLILTSHCGFKVLDKKAQINFSIQEIQTSGEERIGYKIKNNLLANSLKNNTNNLILNINTKKLKSIKEKNIENEVTKYQIYLNVNIQYSFVGKSKNFVSSVSTKGDYLVGSNHLNTINNEKRLIDNLTENISNKILDKIIYNTNDN
tara:strand:- start:118 stop:594 length:477 start_codon:yes stop_codon:yes gene_type:complete